MTEPNTDCARNQSTTQFCAEAVEAHKELRDARVEIERLRSRVGWLDHLDTEEGRKAHANMALLVEMEELKGDLGMERLKTELAKHKEATMDTEPAANMREVFVTWHNFFDTAEYVANNLNIEYPPDCKDQYKYVIERMMALIDLLAKEQDPRPIGENGYIAVPKSGLNNALDVLFFVTVSSHLDNQQKMKYVRNGVFEVQL